MLGDERSPYRSYINATERTILLYYTVPALGGKNTLQRCFRGIERSRHNCSRRAAAQEFTETFELISSALLRALSSAPGCSGKPGDFLRT